MTRRPLITDAAAVPVVGVDHHLPALAKADLHAAALRGAFPVRADWQPPRPGDGLAFDRLPSAASVLVPLVLRPQGLNVLLTRRTDHLHDHAGQVSFPGGRAEPDDADAVSTALREAEEEIGLQRSQVEVLGTMPIYTTVTRFEVTPVVALVHPPMALQLDPFEVATAFEVPLDYLMNPAHHRWHRFEHPEGDRQFLSMPWTGLDQGGRSDTFFIWGATASMLRNLYAWLLEAIAQRQPN